MMCLILPLAASDVDRQHIQDREKWKRETAAKIKETKIKMMKLTGESAKSLLFFSS